MFGAYLHVEIFEVAVLNGEDEMVGVFCELDISSTSPTLVWKRTKESYIMVLTKHNFRMSIALLRATNRCIRGSRILVSEDSKGCQSEQVSKLMRFV